MSRTTLQRLMIASDTLEGIDGALEKAARIEHCTGAAMRVVRTVYDRVADEPAEVLPPQARDKLVASLMDGEERRLVEVIGRWRARVAELDHRVVWARDAASAIIDTAASWRAELLIKPVSRHHPVADFFHTPLDWALMRRSPCAVLIARGTPWQQPGKVMAAVDAADRAHGPLNREILRRAGALAEILGAELHVATAWPDLGQSPSHLQVADDFAGIKRSMRERYAHSLDVMLREVEVEPRERHLLEGRPARVLPALAQRLHATVSVLGTAARGGVAKLLIGNTAEDLIGRLPGDLVTVREPWS